MERTLQPWSLEGPRTTDSAPVKLSKRIERAARGQLSTKKCDSCRKDKRKCLPSEREWPQKCLRCEELDRPCSENRKTKRSRKASSQNLSETTPQSSNFIVPTISTNLPNPLSLQVQKEVLALKAMWVRRVCATVGQADSIHHAISTKVQGFFGFSFPPCIETLKEFLTGEKKQLIRDAKLLSESCLKCNDADGAFEVLMLVTWNDPWLMEIPTEDLISFANVAALFAEKGNIVAAYRIQYSIVTRLTLNEHSLGGKDCDKTHGWHQEQMKRLIVLYTQIQERLRHLRLNDYPLEPLSTEMHFTKQSCGAWNSLPYDCIDAADAIGRKAIHIAVEFSSQRWTEFLIKQGANINNQDSFGRTPLHIACMKENVEIVSILLESRASTQRLMGGKISALHLAVLCGNITLAGKVLQATPYINMMPSATTNSLGFAIRRKDTEMISLLCRFRTDVCESSSNEYPTALALAVDLGNKDAIDTILNASPGFDAGQLGKALSLAILKKDHTMISHLCNRGADVNAEVRHLSKLAGWTLIQIASYTGSNTTMQILLENGADANSNHRPGSERTLLQDAVEKGNIQRVKLLLQFSADVGLMYSSGLRPLDYAALMGYEELMSVLILAGADVNAQNHKYGTPLLAVVKHPSFSDMKLRTVQYLLSKGANVDAQDNSGRTALHIAASRDHPQLARLLLTHGARIDILNNSLSTPLMVAVAKHSTEIVNLMPQVARQQITDYWDDNLYTNISDTTNYKHALVLDLES